VALNFYVHYAVFLALGAIVDLVAAGFQSSSFYFFILFFFQQHPLIPTVKTEKRDGSTTSNPYVAFRRRTEKMQTRKVHFQKLSLCISSDIGEKKVEKHSVR
jgi:hypothetical protein